MFTCSLNCIRMKNKRPILNASTTCRTMYHRQEFQAESIELVALDEWNRCVPEIIATTREGRVAVPTCKTLSSQFIIIIKRHSICINSD